MFSKSYGWFSDNCDEVIESYEEEGNFNEKKAACKKQNF